MENIAQWIAPAATMLAACMTAANLGARFTGWGFVIFTVGSLVWSYIGFSTGQQNLLITNGFLTLVNVLGVYRWLGQQARFEKGGKSAESKSVESQDGPVRSGLQLIGATASSSDDEKLGKVVDLLLHNSTKTIAYLVIADAQSEPLNPNLHAIGVHDLVMTPGDIKLTMSALSFRRLPVIDPDDWPTSVPSIQR